jgi:hypothetical protein
MNNLQIDVSSPANSVASIFAVTPLAISKPFTMN